MTPKELFDKYAGGYARRVGKGGSAGWTEDRYRLCGYHPENPNMILMEHRDGVRLKDLRGMNSGYILIDGNDDVGAFIESVITFDWNDVVMSKRGPNLCSRCGNYYESKKQHRQECNKEKKQ